MLGFCRTGFCVHPCHRTSPTRVIANVLRLFVIRFTSELAAIAFGEQAPKRLAKRGSHGTGKLFPNPEPVCPKASGRPADPPVRDRIGGHPPSESEPHACLAALFRVTSPGKRNPSEDLGSVTIASDQVAIPTPHGRKPILINPETPGF